MEEDSGGSHFELVAPDFQREAALDLLRLVVVRMALQLACCEQSIVCRIEGDGAKLLPVSHHGRFCEDLM